MADTIHVVLGGNGVVGRETIRALAERGRTPVSVGRQPAAAAGAVTARADLLDASDVARVLRGADVAYFVPGLPYSTKVWAAQWPVLLGNAIAAARANGTHLIYLDNVYAYGAVATPMTESTPIAPCSAKGRVRAEALELLDAAQREGLRVTVARSADFYGPGAATSVFNTFALDRIAVGRAATWLFDADQPHSMTYTPDIGRGLARLGEADVTPGGIWHLPTAPPLTGREYLRIALGDAARVSVMRAGTMRIGALFNTPARETLEMSYQYTAPYVFDSSAFQSAFAMDPTSAGDGVHASLAAALARAL